MVSMRMSESAPAAVGHVTHKKQKTLQPVELLCLEDNTTQVNSSVAIDVPLFRPRGAARDPKAPRRASGRRPHETKRPRFGARRGAARTSTGVERAPVVER